MGKTAFLFSGQGSQYVGMGKEFVDIQPGLKSILDCGSEILGFDLQKAINTSTEQELAKTEISQPAIYAVSLIAFKYLNNVIPFEIVAGHSLGEYAAMTAAGMLDMENGFKAIKIRSKAMSRVALKNPGGMAAVIGTQASLIETIEEVCEEVSGSGDFVTPVNYNSSQQTVIAGTESGLEKAMNILTEKGVRRIIRLNVSAAFHSKLMNEAGEEFRKKASSVTFKKPNVDFYSNVYGKKLSELTENDISEYMRDYLTKHICSPVRFTDELIAMQNDGADTFIEIGPGKVLSGLIKKTLGSDNIKIANIEDLKSYNATKEILKL